MSRRTRWIVAGVVVVCLLYLTESEIVPAWRLRVVDAEGKPISGREVGQSWYHYSLELGPGGHEEDRQTDAEGYVNFPRRTIRASLMRRLTIPIINALPFPHNSSGASSHLTVYIQPGSNAHANYKPGEPLPEQIVLPPETENKNTRHDMPKQSDDPVLPPPPLPPNY